LHGVAPARKRLYPAPLLIPYKFRRALLIHQKPVTELLLGHSLYLPLHPTSSTAIARLRGVGALTVKPLRSKGNSSEQAPPICKCS
jgi:hypothetical protein